tara:strand:+ start:2305 stop:2490 length:186 start_codon:yes stop_codon:yes gene_type:complete
MAKEIVAIENIGHTAKLVVKNGTSFTHEKLPLGILRIEPIEYVEDINSTDDVVSNNDNTNN